MFHSGCCEVIQELISLAVAGACNRQKVSGNTPSLRASRLQLGKPPSEISLDSASALDRALDPTEDKSAIRSPYRIRVAVEKIPYPLAIGAIVQAEIIIDRRPFWRLLFLKASKGI